MATSNIFGSPIPLSEIESVLAWVDTFKLSRQTKKITRDFSDAVLLAEILAVHYPKLVEMHNYPPRNSHALKLNNWMTLNRKVLKKLKLNLCVKTMEQLADCTPGVIERVLVMVRDKIKRDEDLEKSFKESENNMSSGGSYYEACGDEDHVLVVPVKTRVNGVLETLQQKVVSYDAYTALKEELKDAKDSVELLKQKVDHLDSLIKLKDERIHELQKQLDRKQARRKDTEILQNSLSVPFDDFPTPSLQAASNPTINKSLTSFKVPSKTQIPLLEIQEPKALPTIPTPRTSSTKIDAQIVLEPSKPEIVEKKSEPKIAPYVPEINAEPSITEVTSKDKIIVPELDVERIKSDVFKEALNANHALEEKGGEGDDLEFKDSEPGTIVTIEDTIDKELSDIGKLEIKTSKSLELKPITSNKS